MTMITDRKSLARKKKHISKVIILSNQTVVQVYESVALNSIIFINVMFPC